MARPSNKATIPSESVVNQDHMEDTRCGPPKMSLLTDWEPNQPITIRLKEFLRVTGIGRSTAFEMMNPRSRLYDETMPSGFKLFDSPNAPRFFFYHEVVTWLNDRAEKSRAKRIAKNGEFEA